jgi:hypothetical protein
VDALTVEEFKQALPDKMRRGINQQVVDQIVNTLNDPDMYETYRENLLSYASVMADGKFKMESYVSAVKYVSHKISGKSNKDSFQLTFPDKIQRWTMAGVSPKDQSSYIAAYNKSKLVMLLMEQTMIPTWVLNQDLYQKALNAQADLMITAKSEMARAAAANSILQALKAPETVKVMLDTTSKAGSLIQSLRETTAQLVEQQRLAIASGMSNAQEIAHSKILIEGEYAHEQQS